MKKNIRIGKLLFVLFLTILIWVWADLSLDDESEVPGATVTVSQSVNADQWVHFEGESSTQLVKNIRLRGPATRIAQINNELGSGTLKLEFFLDPKQEDWNEAGNYTLNMIDFLKKRPRFRQLGLTVESCKPATLAITIQQLVEKKLTIRCLDESGNEIKGVTVVPWQISMNVPSEWSGDALTAYVTLSKSEIEAGRTKTVVKYPYIKLGDQRRDALVQVKINTPTETTQLKEQKVTSAKLYIAMAPTVLGKYEVKVNNLSMVLNVQVRATPDAISAYAQQPYHVTLYILDGDLQKTGVNRRKVAYNFPEEYVRLNEIELSGVPVEAKFELVEITGTTSE